MSDESEIRIATCVFWDLDDFPVPYDLNPNLLYHNLESALTGKGYPGCLKILFYSGNQTLPDKFVAKFRHYGFAAFRIEDSGDIYERASIMVRDSLIWSLNFLVRDNPQPLNLVIVSDKFSSEEREIKELLSFLQVLKSTDIKILLAFSEETESGALFPTVSFELLWRGILIDLGLCPGSNCGYKAHIANKVGQKPPVPANAASLIRRSNPNFDISVEIMSDESEIKVTTCVFWDLDDFPVPENLDPGIVYRNLKSALTDKGFPGPLTIWFFYGDPTDDFVQVFYDGGFSFFCDDSDDIYVKARMMIRDILLWSLDHRKRNNPQPFNLVIVSNKFSSGATHELLSFLQDLNASDFKILLAHSEELESELPFPTESFEWLWQTILADICCVCHEPIFEAPTDSKKPGLE